MSSKVHRGAISTEPVAWKRVPSADSFSGAGPVFPACDYGETGGHESGGRGPAQPQSAYQQGFEAGLTAGREQASADMEAMASQLARSIEELTGLRPRFRQAAEQDVVSLALAIARRILHRELTVDPDALLGLVKAGLEKIELREVHRVRVSREDAARVRHYLEKIGSPQHVEVIADNSLHPGAVILDSSRGTLDASIETQLAEIERGFADLVRRAQ